MPVGIQSTVWPAMVGTNLSLAKVSILEDLEEGNLTGMTFTLKDSLCFTQIWNSSLLGGAESSFLNHCLVLSHWLVADFAPNAMNASVLGMQNIIGPVNFDRNTSGSTSPPCPGPRYINL